MLIYKENYKFNVYTAKYSRPVVSAGTWTESLCRSSDSCCPAPDDVKSGTDTDLDA